MPVRSTGDMVDDNNAAATRIYVSGPIKGQANPEVVFRAAEADLRRRGFDVVNPYDCEPICDCPEDVARTDQTRHYDCFMRGDLRELVTCDGVALLDGWQRSRGAVLEQFVALSVGLPVMPLAMWLRSAAVSA